MNVTYKFTIFVILILQIVVIKAGCYWNTGAPGTECLLQCINENPKSIKQALEDRWNEREHCHTNGIWLRLMSLNYPSNVIESNWFTANVKVYELEVSLNDVVNVSVNAFDSEFDAFQTVKKITITTSTTNSVSLQTFRNGIFNGMSELENIQISGTFNVRTIQNGVLDSLNKLKIFSFSSSNSRDLVMSINGLTSSKRLKNLETFVFRYNLTDSISQSTFKGLTVVKTLNLSNCRIEHIGPNSFNSISKTIEVLNLSNNRLTTLPAGLFDRMLPKKALIINIDGNNNWNCNCDLLPFRLRLKQFEHNFVGSYQCSTQTACKIKNIVESDCFDKCEISPPVTPSSTLSTQDEDSPDYTR